MKRKSHPSYRSQWNQLHRILTSFSFRAFFIVTIVDGTGNNAKDQIPDTTEPYPDKRSRKTFTNVLKLHLLAGGDLVSNSKSSQIDGQVCIYGRGIGGKTDTNTFLGRVMKKKQFALGDLDKQVEPMKKKLNDVYEEGDEVYVVGFSRGSASARKFCVELQKGLPKTGNKAVPVKFLGCFDTVSMQVGKNLGNIVKKNVYVNLKEENLLMDRLKDKMSEFTSSSVLGEEGGRLPDNVNKAVHYVSLDDNRFAPVRFLKNNPFPPCFMDSGDSRVTEIWFPGCHTDVGGTPYEKGIPDNACKKMQDWLKREGLKFYEPEDIPEECRTITKFVTKPTVVDALPATDISPDCSDEIHCDKDDTSHRPVVTITNEGPIEGGRPKIDVGVLEHLEAKKTDYKINPEIFKVVDKLVVVDGFGEELKTETQKFKELLGVYESELLINSS